MKDLEPTLLESIENLKIEWHKLIMNMQIFIEMLAKTNEIIIKIHEKVIEK